MATTLFGDLRSDDLGGALAHLTGLECALTAHHSLEDAHVIPQLEALAKLSPDADAWRWAQKLAEERGAARRQLSASLATLPARACQDLAGFRGELRTVLQILCQRMYLEEQALPVLFARLSPSGSADEPARGDGRVAAETSSG